MCIFYVKALQFPLFVSCWNWAVAPTFMCDYKRGSANTCLCHDWPWNCWSMCSHIHLHKPAPPALENVLQQLL